MRTSDFECLLMEVEAKVSNSYWLHSSESFVLGSVLKLWSK